MPTPEGASPARRPTRTRGPARLLDAVGGLEPEQRIAGMAALALWISMFLPWYSKTVLEVIKSSLKQGAYNLSAFGAFSFVEAAVLLVATATLVLLFARGERRAFHLPGGDGLVILAGGVWVSLLIFYRMLDKPALNGTDKVAATVGLQWGIFFALAASISLAYAGARVRAAHRPEPALRDDPTVARDVAARPAPRRSPPPARRGRPQRPAPAAPRTPAPTPTAAAPTDQLPLPPTQPSRRPADRPRRPPAPPFDADADPAAADAETHAQTRSDPGPAARADAFAAPTREVGPDPPTRVIRRVPRFDDLDAGWVSPDDLSLEADPPTRADPDR